MLNAAMLSVNAGHWLPLLLDVAVKSLLVSAAALAALLCLRRASAATRHLVLLAGVGVLLGLPALMPILPRRELPRPVPAPRAAPAATPVPALSAPTAPPVSEASAAPLDAAPAALPLLPSPPAEMPAPASAPLVNPAWLVPLWLVGVLACAGRMLASQVRVWRLTRRCPPLPVSLLSSAGTETARFSALLTGPAGTPPMVWGWPRAALLLPPEAADWPSARRRAVVLHEAAHVRRCDWLTQTVAQAACALYWFNPLAWLLAARLGAEAERACDDAVLLAGVPPTDYAQDLLAVARHLGAGSTARRVSVGAVTMARRSPVRSRLEAILDTRRVRRRITRRATALALAAALAVAAPLATLRPAARADEGRAGQVAPVMGVPTEAEIAKVQQHLQGLEQARADYAAAHPNRLTAAQIKTVDQLLVALDFERLTKEADASMAAQNEAAYKQAWAEAKKPHTKQERQGIWRMIFMHDHPGPDRGGKIVAERNRIRNLRVAQGLARLKRQVAALPAGQSARETSLYAFDGRIALDETQREAMQMERAEGYPLHFAEGDIAMFAHMGFWNEKRGVGSRADWVLTELLNCKLNQTKHLDDADVDALVALLREPHNTPTVNLANALALFRDMHDAKMRPVPPSQRQKVREAVTPFLTSHSKWPALDRLDHKFSKEVLELYGGNAPTLPPAQKALATPAAMPPARPQPTRQAAQTGVPAMTPLTSMKATLLKTAAFATLAAGLTLPAAHAAPLPPAPKSVVQAAPADALHWDLIALQHTTLQATIGLMRWGHGSPIPDGVKHIFYLMGRNTVLVQATPAGLARMQGIIKALDVAPPRVQIRVATATVSAAALSASSIHFDAVPSDGLGTVGRPLGMSTKAAEGDAVGVYLAALAGQGAVSQAPVATLGGEEAYIDLSHIPDTPGLKSAELGVTGRINADGSVTVRLEPILLLFVTPTVVPGPDPVTTR